MGLYWPYIYILYFILFYCILLYLPNIYYDIYPYLSIPCPPTIWSSNHCFDHGMDKCRRHAKASSADSWVSPTEWENNSAMLALTPGMLPKDAIKCIQTQFPQLQSGNLWWSWWWFTPTTIKKRTQPEWLGDWASMRQLCPPIWSTLASTMHQAYRPRRPRRWASGHMLRKRWRSKGSCTSSSAEELGIPRSVKVSTYFIFLHVSTASNTRKRSCEVLILNLFFVRSPPDDCFLQLSAFWASGVTQRESQSQSRTPFHLGNCGEWDKLQTSQLLHIGLHWTSLQWINLHQSANINTLLVLGMRCLRESKDVDREESPPLPWMKHHGQGALR